MTIIKKHSYTPLVVGCLLAFWSMNRAGFLYQSSQASGINRLLETLNALTQQLLLHPLWLALDGVSILWGTCAAALVCLAYLYVIFGTRPRLPGKEHGSATWGTDATIKPFLDSDSKNNIILTETESLSMSSRMKRTDEDDFNRNKNVLILGGSGSSKTRGHVKPNILQMNCNYALTDPKGALLKECGHALAENGYTIKVFNLKDRAESDHYNLFAYLENEDDVVKIAKNLIKNMKDDPNGMPPNDPIWEEGMTALIEAVFGYVLFELLPQERNMSSAMQLFSLLSIDGNSEKFVSPLDMVFRRLQAQKPDSFAVKQYQIYKMAPPKTAQSINISLGLRLSAFNIPSIAKITSDDTLNLKELGEDKKVALFIVLPDTTRAFNFLAVVMYQQLFDMLVTQADSRPEQRLPRHVRFILDEFANIGKIPDFEILIATIRQREISATIILQSMSQLKSAYKDDWETIVNNCDTFLFLGGVSTPDSLEYVSKKLGKATIETISTSDTRGTQGSFQKSYQLLGRELLTPDEVGRLKRRYCILFISGVAPFYSRKYSLEKHPNYHLLSDADPKNIFTYERRKEYAAQSFLSTVSDVEDISLSELNNL